MKINLEEQDDATLMILGIRSGAADKVNMHHQNNYDPSGEKLVTVLEFIVSRLQVDYDTPPVYRMPDREDGFLDPHTRKELIEKIRAEWERLGNVILGIHDMNEEVSP